MSTPSDTSTIRADQTVSRTGPARAKSDGTAAITHCHTPTSPKDVLFGWSSTTPGMEHLKLQSMLCSPSNLTRYTLEPVLPGLTGPNSTIDPGTSFDIILPPTLGSATKGEGDADESSKIPVYRFDTMDGGSKQATWLEVNVANLMISGSSDDVDPAITHEGIIIISSRDDDRLPKGAYRLIGTKWDGYDCLPETNTSIAPNVDGKEGVGPMWIRFPDSAKTTVDGQMARVPMEGVHEKTLVEMWLNPTE